MSSVEILVPNRHTWEAIELTVESVLARTNYPNFSLTVCDNSSADHDGNRLEYLRDMEHRGRIKLLRNIRPMHKYKEYGHGENIKVMLSQCETDFAMLLSSGVEAVQKHWLKILVNLIQTKWDLGVAKFVAPRNHFDKCWAAPRFVPNWMLLDMRKYRRFGNIDEDWRFDRIMLPAYDHPEYFEELPKLKNPDCDPPRVFRDTGWRLYDRLETENPERLKMIPLPHGFHKNELHWYGGLDRNSHRPEHPHVVKTRKAIWARLDDLRRRG